MKYIQAVLTFKFPKDRLTPDQQAQLPKEFEDVRKELSVECPDDVIATLTVEEVDE